MSIIEPIKDVADWTVDDWRGAFNTLSELYSKALARAEAAEVIASAPDKVIDNMTAVMSERLAAEARVAELEARVEQVSKMTAIATSPGNWDYDPYLHGMANALLLAYAVMENLSYKPLDAPERWLSARDIPLPPPPSGE